MTALKPLNRLVTIACVCLLNTLCSAQDKAKEPLGKISAADFTIPARSPLIDSNSHAIVLADEGVVQYIGNKHDWFSYVFTRHTRIKIIDGNAIPLGKVRIRLYGRGDYLEKVSKVEGVTYNLEKGQVVATKIEEKDLFHDQIDKEWAEAKFALPGVKAGSIIEYSYTITSDFWYQLPSWRFQWEDCPCLFSQLQVEIPRTMRFMTIKQGAQGYSTDKGSDGEQNYKITSVPTIGDPLVQFYSINTIKHVYEMKDVPGFHRENYLSAPENYLDKIDFQLSQTNNGYTASDRNNNWARTTDALLKREDFGGALTSNDPQVVELTAKITGGGLDALGRARAIYGYVSSNMTCTNPNDKYVNTNLRDVLKTNRGTVGDINLLLIAMLRIAGLHADPVLLTTREFGFNPASYPLLGRFNYVVACLKFAGRSYYLDAARPELGFGQLAADCYNGHARVICNSDSGAVWLWPDSLKEKKMTTVLLFSTERGLEGQYESTLGKEESYKLRRNIAEKGQDAWFKDLQTRWGQDLEISDGGIDSLHRLEDPVNLHYKLLIKQAPGAAQIYLTPMLGDGYKHNPFPAAERKYPVELSSASDETYGFSMEIPDGYAIDELPKSTRVALNGDQGAFEYLVQQGDGRIQLRCRVLLNKAWFPAEDYPGLRDFFAFIVKKQSEPIVLKKK